MPNGFIVPYGPQHAAFLEPFNLRLTVEEEVVVGAELNFGYNHRGMEHALAQDYKRTQFLAERVCGICSYHHASVYCQTMETMYGVTISDRANLVRLIMMECQRLTSHLLALGHIAETIGYENLFMQFFREREEVMQLVNRISGGRVHYSMNAIGGLRKDVTYEQLQDVEATMDRLEPKFLELQRIVRKDITLRRRLRGVGLLTKKDAMDWCTVGPTSRGSGLPHDVRLTSYGGYGVEGIKFRPIYYEEGDCYARTMVRMDEVLQAVDLIRQALDLDPGRAGPGAGERATPTERPMAGWRRRAASYYIMSRANGTTMLDRVKLRTPALVNIPALTAMVPGCRFADVAVITVSVDPCVCCTDR